MSRVVDDRVVEMQFDNRDFEKNVGQSLSTLDKLKAALSFKGNENSFNVVEQGAQKVSESFSAMEHIAIGALRNFGSKLENWAENTVKTLSGVKQVVSGFNKYTTLTESSFTLEGQGFSTEEINKQLKRMTWFTDETSYDLSDMVDNMAKFTSKGIGLKDAADDMMGIALWAASAGQNSQAASRAMYQLSQAMAGPMNLMDWKSIENVNMNTAEFQKIALETAAAMGTVEKNAKGMYRSIAEGSQYKDWFTYDKDFRNSLAGKWFTPEVQSAVYKKYTTAVDQIYEYIRKHPGTLVADAVEALGSQLDEFGLHALLMGQQSKTWADTMNATADAVSTKWSAIFTHIFGNAKQSTRFFSALTEEFYTMFAEPMNGLVDVFQNWRQAFGRKEWQNSLISMLQSVNTIVDSIRSTIDKFSFGDRAQQMIAYSRKVKKAYEIAGIGLRKGKNGSVIGSDRLLINNPGDEYEVMTKAKAARLMDLTHKFTEFSEKVKKAAEDTSFFERSTMGILSAFGLVKEAISGLWRALEPLRTLAKGVIKKAIGLILKLADAITKLYLKVKANNSFEKAFKKLFAPIFRFEEIGRKFIKGFLTKFKERWESFASNFESVSGKFSSAKKKIQNALGGIADWWANLFSNITDEDIENAIDSVFNALSKLKGLIYSFIGVSNDAEFATWISDTFDSAVQSIKDFRSKAKEHLGEVGNDLQDFGGGALQWFKDHWEDIKSFLSNAYQVISGFFSKLKDGFNKIFGSDSEDGTSRLEKIKKAFQDFGAVLGTVFGTITNALAPIAAGLKNTLESLNLENAGNFLKGGGFALLGVGFYKWSKKFRKSSWLAGIKEVLEGLGETLNGFTRLLNAKALKEAAIGIAVLVGSLLVLMSIPEKELYRSATVMGAIILILAKSLAKLSELQTTASINSKGFNISKSGSGSTIVMAAFALLVIAGALRLIAKIPEKDLYRAASVIGVISFVLTGFIKAIGTMNSNKGDVNNQSITGIKVGGPSSTILALAIFLGVVLLALKSISDMVGGNNADQFYTALGVVGGILAALTGFLILVSKFYKTTEKTTAKSTTSTKMGNALWKDMIALAASIYIIAMAFEKLAGLESIASPGMLIGISAFILGVMGLFVAIAAATKGRSFNNFGKFANGLIVISIAIGIIAMVMAELAKLPKKSKLGLAMGAIAAIAVVLGALSALGMKKITTEKAAKRFLMYAGSLALIAVALTVAAYGLVELSKLDLDAKKVLTIIGAIALIFGSFAAIGAVSSGKIGDGLIKFGKGLVYIAGAAALVAVAFLAMAEAIRIFSDSSLDIDTAAKNITDFMDKILAKIPDWLGTILETALQLLLGWVEPLGRGLVDTLSSTLAYLLEPDEITGKMRIEQLVEDALKVVLAIVHGITDHIDEIVEAVGGLILGVLTSLANWASTNQEEISKALSDTIDAFIDIILGLFDGLGNDIFGDAWDEIKDCLKNVAKVYLGVTVIGWLVNTFVPGVVGALNPISAAIMAIVGSFALIDAGISALQAHYDKLNQIDADDVSIWANARVKAGKMTRAAADKIVESARNGMYKIKNNKLYFDGIWGDERVSDEWLEKLYGAKPMETATIHAGRSLTDIEADRVRSAAMADLTREIATANRNAENHMMHSYSAVDQFSDKKSSPVSVTFNQNFTSPKALNDIEIYRNFKNSTGLTFAGARFISSGIDLQSVRAGGRR